MSCPVSTTLTVEAPEGPIFTVSDEVLACNGDLNGFTTITGGGTGVIYTVQEDLSSGIWNPSASLISNTVVGSTLTLDNSGAGSYIVRGTGTNGCITDRTFTVTEPLALSVLPGSLTVTPYGCDAGEESPNAATIVFDTATAGNITGGNGSPFTVQLMSKGLDGSISGDDVLASPSGSSEISGVYTYSFTDGLGGSYYLSISDSKSCPVIVDNIDIDAFISVTGITINPVLDITCEEGEIFTMSFSTSDGSTITGDVAIYESSDLTTALTGTGAPSTLDTGVVSGNIELEAGDYVITVTNPDTGCVYSIDHQVLPLSDFGITATPIGSVSCVGGSVDVSLEIAPSISYTGNYTYTVMNSDTTPTSITGSITGIASGGILTTTIANVPAGDYYVVVDLAVDPGVNCNYVSNDFTITEPSAALSLTASATPTNCIDELTGSGTGVVSALAQNGWGTYSYRLVSIPSIGAAVVSESSVSTSYDGYASRNTFTGLLDGFYRVYVQDLNGCIISEDVEVEEPLAIVIGSADYDSCSETVEVTVNNGSSPYTYELNNTGGNVLTQTGNNVFDVSGLSAGVYEVLVRDSKLCETATSSVTIYEPLSYEFLPDLSTNLDCLGGDISYDLTINTGSGLGNYSYELIKDPEGLATSIIGNTSIISNTERITILNEADDSNQGSGVYELIVTDSNSASCAVSTRITISDPVVPLFTTTSVKSDCNGGVGSITIDKIAGVGVSYQVYEDDGSGVWSSGLTLVPGTNYDSVESSITGANLFAGDYIVLGTGSNGCVSESSVRIEEPNALLPPVISVVGYECSAGSNEENAASISFSFDSSVSISGGNGNYTFELYERSRGLESNISLSELSGVYTFSLTDRLGGDYYILVTDSKGCTVESNEESIEPYVELDVISMNIVSDITCSVGEISTVSYSVLGGTISNGEVVIEFIEQDGSYTTIANYTLANGTPSNAIELAEGDYIITVTNPDTGCSITDIYQVGSPDEYFVSITEELDITCLGSNNGEVSFTIDGDQTYTGSYDYTIVSTDTSIGTIGSGTATGIMTYSGLTEGTYYIEATMLSAPNCNVISNEFTISEPETQLSVTYDLGLINCYSDDTGSVVLTGDGGWFGFEYRLEKVDVSSNIEVQDFATNNTIQGLDAGEYIAIVRDARGCTEAVQFQLENPADINYQIVITDVDNLCEGENGASIEVNVNTGGQVNDINNIYSYIITYPNGTESAPQTSNIFTGLFAGDYKIRVFDSYGCYSDEEDWTITDPNEVTAEAAYTDKITCDNNIVEVTVTGDGGTGVYTYSDSEDPTTFTNNNVFNVGVGYHLFYVMDSNGCISERYPVQVFDYTDLEVSLNVITSSITCYNNNNGILSATAKFGFGNYEYELLDENDTVLQGPQTSEIFYGITAGTYKIRVTSDGICSAVTEEYTIENPDELILNTPEITPVTCSGDTDGAIKITAEGGTGDYVFFISSDPLSINPQINFSDGTKGIEFTGLAPGIHTVTVQDRNGCQTTIADIEIASPDPIVASLVGTVAQQVCLSDATPSAEISIAGGVAPYTIYLNGVLHNDVIIGTLDPITNETIYTLTNLPVGESNVQMLVTIEDSSGCTENMADILETIPPIDLQLALEAVPNCEGETIITATVAEAYQAEDEVIYTLIDADGTETLSETGIFTVTTSGNYTVVATHVLTECEDTEDIDVTVYEALSFEVDDSSQNLLIVSGIGGDGNYEYSIDGSDYYSDYEFIITETRDYVISVRDSRGCIYTQSVPGEFIAIEIPNIFTPNGDGDNDYWYPINIEDYHDVVIYVYDRYGREIEIFRGNHQGWDGTYDGKPLPSGDYWYTIQFKELTGEEKRLMGHFTLFR